MDEKTLETIKRLSWGDIKKHVASKTPFEAISPMGSMLIRIKSYAPVMALMAHTGHRVREEIISKMSIEEDDRLLDEDALLAPMVEAFPIQVLGLDSRYEYDVDRKRDDAIYLKPFQCWGKKVWINPPSKDEIDVSLQKYDEFHDLLDYLVEECLKLHPKLCVLDLQGTTPKPGTKISAPYQIDVDPSPLPQGTFSKSLEAFVQALKSASPHSGASGGTKVAGQLAKLCLQRSGVLPVSAAVGRPAKGLPAPAAVASALFKGAQATLEHL